MGDLFTAVFYAVSLSYCTKVDDSWNAIQVYLDIYFPVTTFVWTDCVALFLCASLKQYNWIRKLKMFPNGLKKLFLYFHCVSWIIPFILCVLPLIIIKNVTNESNENIFGNYRAATGGWCWIDKFYYQLIGGKTAEFISIVFVSICYCQSWYTLRFGALSFKNTLDNHNSNNNNYHSNNCNSDNRNNNNNNNSNNTNTIADCNKNIVENKKIVTINPNYNSNYKLMMNGNNNMSNVVYGGNTQVKQGKQVKQQGKNLSHSLSREEPNLQQTNINNKMNMNDIRRRRRNRNRNKLNRSAARSQYDRLMLVPLAFFFIRLPCIWRVVFGGYCQILYNNNDASCDESRWENVDDVLGYIQAFCDPAQGWINCLLFVFCTKTVRKIMFYRSKQFIERYVNICSCIKFVADYIILCRFLFCIPGCNCYYRYRLRSTTYDSRKSNNNKNNINNGGNHTRIDSTTDDTGTFASNTTNKTKPDSSVNLSVTAPDNFDSHEQLKPIKCCYDEEKNEICFYFCCFLPLDCVCTSCGILCSDCDPICSQC